MLPGSGKTFINSALVYAAEERRIACFAGLVGGISIVATPQSSRQPAGRLGRVRHYRRTCNEPYPDDEVERRGLF
jgi:hypothetical protein